MFPQGTYLLLSAFLPVPLATAVAIALPLLVVLLWCVGLAAAMSRRERDDEPVSLPGSPLVGIRAFFNSRFDFINRGFALTGAACYQFRLLRTPVIVLSGEAARRDFFQAKELDLTAGFKFLSGALPMIPGVTSDLDPRTITHIHRRLASAQTSDRLERLMPKILEDFQNVLTSWGAAGTIDPFTRISELLFQVSVRCLGFSELADDAPTVARLKGLYDILDNATTPASVLFPWFPTPSLIRRLVATYRIYDIIGGALDARLKSGVARDDTPQMLIDSGDERMIIIGFVMGLLVAGARSTGTTASWMVTFLSAHPEWKGKVAEEVRTLITQHATTCYPPASATPQAQCNDQNNAPSTPYDFATPTLALNSTVQAPLSCVPSTPQTPTLSALSATLASVPLPAWEAHTPVLDLVIRETLRVAEPHVAMRQYRPSAASEKGGAELRLGGTRVPPGAYVVYPFSDVHLSPAIYPDPWRWDPARAELALKAPYAYVGLGAGSTPCLGQRLAKLQLKLLAGVFALGFDELGAVGRKGEPLVGAALPKPDWNDALTCKPPAGSCRVRFARPAEGAWR